MSVFAWGNFVDVSALVGAHRERQCEGEACLGQPILICKASVRAGNVMSRPKRSLIHVRVRLDTLSYRMIISNAFVIAIDFLFIPFTALDLVQTLLHE